MNTTTKARDCMTDAPRRAAAMFGMAMFTTSKAAIVTHLAIAEHAPMLLHTEEERSTGRAKDPEMMSIYDRKGTLLATAHPEPIWERSIKCTMPNGFVFYVGDSLQFPGKDEFWLSSIFSHWIGQEGASYEVIDQEPIWESTQLQRVSGLKPGSMLVVEHCKHNGTTVLMASEHKFSIAQVRQHLGYLDNGNWKVEPWTLLKGWNDYNHQWCYFDAHKGQMVRFATSRLASVCIYITA